MNYKIVRVRPNRQDFHFRQFLLVHLLIEQEKLLSSSHSNNTVNPVFVSENNLLFEP